MHISLFLSLSLVKKGSPTLRLLLLPPAASGIGPSASSLAYLSRWTAAVVDRRQMAEPFYSVGTAGCIWRRIRCLPIAA